MQPINSHQRKIILIGLGLLLLVILTYLPVRNNVFIFFDDPGYVMGNPHVQSGVTWGNVKWAMTSTVGGNWHPLTWVSHMLDCQWFGLNPRWHHLTSLLLHAVNTVLVFLVLEGMTGAVWRSFFVAAMFGVHPLHVESVAWVSERKDVLSTLFWMLTLWAYARYVTEGKRTSYIELPIRETADHASCDMQHGEKSGVQGPKSKVWYGCALVTFALGLMCKPMLVTLPFVLLLLDFWPLNRFPQKNLMKLAVEKAPFFLLSIAICVITIPAQKGAGAVRTMANFPLMVRLENVPVSYCRYLGKLFWPANLPFFYPYPVHWPPVAVLGATLLLLCLLICAWMTRRDHPYFLMGWCWFVGILVPVIGLVQVGFQSIANRYTYVPSIGIFLALSWGVPALIRHWRHQFFVLFTLATTAILVCIPVTRIQIGYWKDSVTLFQYASVVIKNNWGAHAQLGLYFSEEGRLDEAVSEYRQVLKVKPDDADAHYDLANVLYRKGLWDEAISEYREDLKLSPNDTEGHNNLGVILFRKGNRTEAITHFKEALRLKPDFADVQKNLAAAMAGQKTTPPSAPPVPSAPPIN